MKQFEMLYIDGKSVNIGDTNISLEWKSVMLSNISKMKCSHSYTIKLPMTATNRQIFESPESAEHNAYVFGNGIKSSLGRRMSARYYCNGIDVLGPANAYLIGTDKDYYKIVLTWGTLSAIQNIIDEDKTLPELFGGKDIQPNFVMWEQWPQSQISSEYGEDIMCLRYSNGVVGDDFYGYLYYLPSFKVTYLLDRIFKKFNIDYDFTREYTQKDGAKERKVEKLLDSLYCPITSMNDSEFYQERNKFRWVFEPMATEFSGGHTQLESYKYPTFYNMRIGWIHQVKAPNHIRAWYGFFLSMKYKIKTHVRVFINAARIDKTEAEIFSNVKLTIVNGIGNKDASKLLALSATYISGEWVGVKLPTPSSSILQGIEQGKWYEVRFEYLTDWEEVSDNDNPGNGDWEGLHIGEYKWEDVIEIRQGRRVWIDGAERAYIGDATIPCMDESGQKIYLKSKKTDQEPSNYESYIEVIPCIKEGHPYQKETQEVEYLQNATPIYFEPNFPEMKPIDFLKGVFYVVGGYPIIYNGKLRLVLYRDLIDNVDKAVDWSNFLTNDYAMPSSIDFVLSDWAQVNKLRWKSDNEDNPKYSGSFEIKDPYLNTENDVFTLPFEGCDTDRGMAKVPLYESGKVINYVKLKGTGHLQYASYAKEVEGFVFKECKPRIGVRHKNEAVENTTDTTEHSSLDYLTFEELSFRSKGGLMDTRYKVFSEMLKHPYVVTDNMELDEFTLGNLDMSVPVYLRQYGSYFGIQSIKRKSDGKCTVQLLKIPNSLIKANNNE